MRRVNATDRYIVLVFKSASSSNMLERALAAFQGMTMRWSDSTATDEPIHVDVEFEHDSPADAYIAAAFVGEPFRFYQWDPTRNTCGTHRLQLTVTATQYKNAALFCEARHGAPYNNGVYVACLLNARWAKRVPFSYFCSEICAELLVDMGVCTVAELHHVSGRVPATITPTQLLYACRKLGIGEEKPLRGATV
jgi:hypothetical protein